MSAQGFWRWSTAASGLMLVGLPLVAGSRPSDAVGVPKIVVRPVQRYVAVHASVPMKALDSIIPNGLSQVFAWLKAKGVKPAGAPFTRYHFIDMPKKLDIEVGVPVGRALAGSGPVHAGSFPAGSYATYTYEGNYKGLVGANAAIQSWAQKNRVQLDRRQVPAGIVWGGRAEYYLTDPSTERDPNKWKTEIVYLLSKRRGAS